MAELRGIFPVTWVVQPNPIWFYQEVLFNWLDIEIDAHAEEKMPMLRELKGWRNREVHEYVWNMDSKEWVRQMYGHTLEI